MVTDVHYELCRYDNNSIGLLYNSAQSADSI